MAGDPYRQEVREKHLGAKGAHREQDKNTPCGAFPGSVVLYVFCCHFI